MSEKFTEEPWEISDMSGVDAMDNFTVCFHIGVSSTGEMIADCQSNNKADYERVKANAYLIAAAPEMYRALEDVCSDCERLSNWEDLFNIGRPGGTQMPPCPCKDCYVAKALKKARGEE